MRNDLHFPAPYCQYAHLREALGTPSLRAECNPYACSATNNTSMQSVCLLSHQQYRSSQSHLILKYSAAPMQHSPATHSDYHGAQEEVGAHSTLPPRMIPLKISFTRRQQIHAANKYLSAPRLRLATARGRPFLSTNLRQWA